VIAGRHSLDIGIEARREAVRSDRVVGRDRTQHTIESYVQTTLTSGTLTIVPGLRASRSDPWGTHWTPRIAAMYRPVPELALRISGGEGFRAPAFKELYMEFLNIGPGFAYTVRGNADLEPEVSRNVTASFEWAGQQTWVRVQAFTNTFTDFIETRAIGDSSGITVYTYGNVDDGFTRGGEIEGGAAVGGWRFEGGYSLLRAERAETGEALLGRPGHSLRGTLGYAHPSGLRLSVTGVRTGRTAMSRTESATEWREPFARFDLRVARELPAGLELVAGMDNVLDQQMNDWPGFTGRHIYTSLSWRAARAGSDRN
jgi:outer membrane receptor for ferrienterochelin and colicins